MDQAQSSAQVNLPSEDQGGRDALWMWVRVPVWFQRLAACGPLDRPSVQWDRPVLRRSLSTGLGRWNPISATIQSRR